MFPFPSMKNPNPNPTFTEVKVNTNLIFGKNSEPNPYRQRTQTAHEPNILASLPSVLVMSVH